MDNGLVQVIVAAITALSASPLVIKYIDYLISKQAEEQRRKRFDVKLHDSELIRNLKKYGREVSNLKFGNKNMTYSPFKTKVGIDMLRIKFDISKDIIDNWIKIHEATLNNMGKDEVLDAMHALITKIIKSYNEEWIRVGIPVMVIDKFNEYHLSNERWVRTSIDCFLENEWDTMTERVYSIFRIIANAYNRAFMDADKLFKSMNGELAGVEYKQSVCEG